MRFTTIFPEAENVHLIKSCGMVPFSIQKYHGYESTFVCYDNDDYSYLENKVKGLRMRFLKKKFNNKLLDSSWYLFKNARKIDVLHLYHLSKQSLILAYLYKMFNNKGIVYLKLDNTDKNIFNARKISDLEIKTKLKLMKVFNIISTESLEAAKSNNAKFSLDLKYIQNGFYDQKEEIDFNNKKNIILTVARIGSPQKSNDVMLEGFAQVAEKIPEWRLKMVGPIEPSFKTYIKSFFEKNPHLVDRIEFTGPIKDREKLNSLYNSSKIFTLTSNYEGFPTVFLEALKSGCYLLTSNFNVANEITNYGEFGKVFEIGDVEGFASELLEACNKEKLTARKHLEIQEYAFNDYYWPKTIDKLDKLIKAIN